MTHNHHHGNHGYNHDGYNHVEPDKTKDKEDSVPWYIKIFGASLVSVCVLLIVFAFNQAYNQVYDLQGQLRSTNEKIYQLQERVKLLETKQK